ncbi:MAG: leucyl aminopeptidase [Chloroflexota bacterium]|nr:leucyl aminopeptidase [Chloroflexota bacterium]
MRINVVAGDIAQQDVGAVVVNLFEGITTPGGATGAVDKAMGGAISALIADGEIKGKSGEMTLIHTLGSITPKRVLVAGLGSADSFTLDGVRSVAAEAARHLNGIGVQSAATIVHGAGIAGLDEQASAQALAEGIVLGMYRFDKYKADASDANLNEMTVVEFDESKLDALRSGIDVGSIIGEGVNRCRDMANEPANSMTPSEMAEQALEVSQAHGVELEVIERPQMKELGMGALLAVARASEEPPKFIIMRYNGDPQNTENNIGLLGKGITFDSGGLDIKNASGMATMKGDMAGGASVIGAMEAIAQLKPKINVTVIVPAAENMVSGAALRPGDVIRAMNGKTIEIDNTDAEGRLVLADAMSYARSVGLNRLVDVATLTGAMGVALGDKCMGAFGNDDEFTQQVVSAGNAVGERAWPLPMYDEYKTQYRSDIADIKNTGGSGAGAITGALIIGEFNDGAPWVHLDIAGVARTGSVKGANIKGATGAPVRTLVRLVCDLAR